MRECDPFSRTKVAALQEKIKLFANKTVISDNNDIRSDNNDIVSSAGDKTFFSQFFLLVVNVNF